VGHDQLASTSPNVSRFIIIGNPENRRVGLFQEALVRQAQPPARVLPWLDLTREGRVEERLQEIGGEPAMVRVDSFGEDFEVERQLLLRGFEDAGEVGAWAAPPDEVRALTFERGRIYAPRQQHCGFVRVLRELERAFAARPWLRVLNAPKSIEQLFDKRACAVAFESAGIPTPRALAGIRTPDELRERMAETQTPRVFVKLSCGSSASCLALYDYDASRRSDAWLFTSMEIDGDRLYNSLRPRRYRDSTSIDRLLAFLFREGSHVEEHVPKARFGGKFFDTRMLAIDGEVAFTVVRKSAHPITNLHLGGTRGTLTELETLVPHDVLAAAYATCRKVSALHDCLHVGVDLMFTANLDDHRVLEANAFGDLFPNVEREGLSVYEWEIRKALGLANAAGA
jgi:hypothetical protein